jgi:hypothetical protein
MQLALPKIARPLMYLPRPSMPDLTPVNNMGPTDRSIRGVLGLIMLAMGLFGSHRNLWSGLGVGVGAAFLIYGITGYDPLLKLFGASTRKEADNHLINLAKQALPGHGDKPMTVQQPMPRSSIRRREIEQGLQTLSDALALR